MLKCRKVKAYELFVITYVNDMDYHVAVNYLFERSERILFVYKRETQYFSSKLNLRYINILQSLFYDNFLRASITTSPNSHVKNQNLRTYK